MAIINLEILSCHHSCNKFVIERLFNLYKDEQNKPQKGLILKSLFICLIYIFIKEPLWKFMQNQLYLMIK